MADSIFKQMGVVIRNSLDSLKTELTTEINTVNTNITSKLDNLQNYTLPVATNTTLGGVKAGDNVTIDANGVLSASGAVDSVAGKTGVVTLAKSDVGLNNVDNTSDANKNVLSATKLATARTINGVAFDGTANITVSDSTAVKLTGDQTIDGVITFSSSPIVPTPASGDNSRRVATTAYVKAEVNTKQDTLVSGTSIKTINSSSMLGSGNLALLTATNPSITGSITEEVYNLTGTQINPANGTIQYKTVSANTTFTETLTAGQSVLLRLIGASNYTITFPTITWVTATAPTLTANCAVIIWKEQTTLYGAYVGSLV